MDLSIYTAELRDSLQAAASIGDENSRRAAGALAAALEPAARLALMHALSDLAAEVTAQFNDAADGESLSVDVRLEGRDLRVVTGRHSSGGTAGSASSSSSASSGGGAASAAGSQTYSEAPDRTFADASGDLTRTTVRMFNELKGRAEKAASEQGVSLNSFISRAVADSIKTDIPRKWRDKHENRRDESARTGDSASTISGYVQG